MSFQKKILQMLAERKISPEEASKLLDQRNTVRKKLNILVSRSTEEDDYEQIVKMSLPYDIIRSGSYFFPRSLSEIEIGNISFDLSYIKWKEIMELFINDDLEDGIEIEVASKNNSKIIVNIFPSQ